MTGWIIAGFFTSFGILCFAMVLYGMVLFRRLSGTGGWLIIPLQERDCIAYYRWLKSMGILRCRIIPSDLPDLFREQEEWEEKGLTDQDTAR